MMNGTMAKRKTWAERFKAWRKNLDITQAEAADKLGVPLRTFISWENSHRTPGKMAQKFIKLTFPKI